MRDNKENQNKGCLYYDAGNTLYKISVSFSENAKESVEDILVRMILSDKELNS